MQQIASLAPGDRPGTRNLCLTCVVAVHALVQQFPRIIARQCAGNRPPERPKFQQEMATQAFDGVLADRHRTADGSAEYVHIVFGAQQMQNEKIDSKAVNVIDAEFLFLTGTWHMHCAACIQNTTAAIASVSAVPWLGATHQSLHGVLVFCCHKSLRGPCICCYKRTSDVHFHSMTDHADAPYWGYHYSECAYFSARVFLTAAYKFLCLRCVCVGDSKPGDEADNPSFPADDNIVDIRASSRGIPGQSDGQVSLSLSKGLVYDQNIAQRQLERLRKAMQWESAPVITGFDPRYNQNQSLFFEKLYQPFLPKSQRTTFGDDRP